MVPLNDTTAEQRFEGGVQQAAQMIRNIVDRRKHRLPHNHPDFKVKSDE